MKIVVMGATGTIGTAVASALESGMRWSAFLELVRYLKAIEETMNGQILRPV